MTDDQDEQDPAGEFPPGLEALSAEIERLTNGKPDSEDSQDRRKHVEQWASSTLLDYARRALEQADGDPSALGGQLAEALSAWNSRADVVISYAGRILIGEAKTYAAAGVAGASAAAANPVVLTDPGAGAAVDKLDVQKPGILDHLPPAHVLYIILIWLLTVGLPVVMERFKLPSDVVEQIETDPSLIGLALTLTLVLLARRKRK